MPFSTEDFWYELLESATPEDIAAFQKWLRENPQKIENYLKVCAEVLADESKVEEITGAVLSLGKLSH